MNKKIILTSIIAVSFFTGSVFAEYFPGDGLMQENIIYENAAIFSNIHVSGGTVTARAVYEPNQYNINCGYYLPAGATEPLLCEPGYYCECASPVYFDAEHDSENKKSCPSGYTSDAGANTKATCYQQCTLSNVNDEHAIAAGGKIYYHGEELSVNILYDTCTSTACKNGYHIQNGILNLNGYIGLTSYSVIKNGRFVESALNESLIKGQDFYGISQNNQFAFNWDNHGTVTGRGYCSTRPGTNNDLTWTNPTTYSENEIVDESGNDGAVYCYCRIDTYKPANGDVQQLDTKWVFLSKTNANGGVSTAEMRCEKNCGYACFEYTALAGFYDETPVELRDTVFAGTNLLTTPSCVQTFYNIDPGYYLPAGATELVLCPPDSFCPGLTNVSLDQNNAQGISPCPDHFYSLPGSAQQTDCGKKLHVGNDVMYLTGTKQSTPALAVRADTNVYYGKMSPVSDGVKLMNDKASKSLRIRVKDIDYYVHDNSVTTNP